MYAQVWMKENEENRRRKQVKSNGEYEEEKLIKYQIGAILIDEKIYHEWNCKS